MNDQRSEERGGRLESRKSVTCAQFPYSRNLWQNCMHCLLDAKREYRCMVITVTSMHAALDHNYVLLLTTNTLERDAVINVLVDVKKAEIPADHCGARIGFCDGRFVLLINGTSGTQEETSLNRILHRLFQTHFPKPSAILLVGIGWGNPAHSEIGDVLVSSEVVAANHLRQVSGNAFRRTRRHSSPVGATSELVEILNAAYPNLTVRSGPLVSAELFLGDTAARDELLASATDASGGDMEAHLVVPDLIFPWLIVKGISDYGGDGTDRSEQAKAAKNAASIIPALLNQLSLAERIKPPRHDRQTQALLDVVRGNTIHIGRDDCKDIPLNTYLNDDVGPQLISRFERYASEFNRDGRIIRQLVDVILELTQNTLRHADATSVTIDFGETSIKLEDNGRPFDPTRLDLSTGNGGSKAWHLLKHDFIEAGSIEFSYRDGAGKRPNQSCFKMLALSQALRFARDKCAISLDWNTSTVGIPKLRFDPNCDTLFFDVSNILMTSRRMGFIDELKSLLADGKGVYICCRDGDEVLEWERELASVATDRLKIFVGRASNL